MSEKLWWYLARSTGIVAWTLITVSVLCGLLFTTKLLAGKPTPKWLLDLHRFLGGLAVSFTVLHLVTLTLDSYTSFGPADFLVPMASAWKPIPVSIGVVAMYLLIAVEASSLAMRRLPRRWWRAIHLASFASFWAATWHGVTVGSDAANPLMTLAYVSAAAAVVFLTTFRVLADRKRQARSTASPRTKTATTDDAKVSVSV